MELSVPGLLTSFEQLRETGHPKPLLHPSSPNSSYSSYPRPSFLSYKFSNSLLSFYVLQVVVVFFEFIGVRRGSKNFSNCPHLFSPLDPHEPDNQVTLLHLSSTTNLRCPDVSSLIEKGRGSLRSVRRSSHTLPEFGST